MRLYLFDVDGTLISAHGAGRLALTRALEDTYGTAGPADLYDSRGKTDPPDRIRAHDGRRHPAGRGPGAA